MIDLRPVLHIGGILLCVMAAAMIVPALADAAASNPDWIVFITSAAMTAFVGGSLALATHSREPIEMSRRQAFLLTTSAWLMLSAAGMLPLLFYDGGLGFVDALFESVSGITTTGSTVMTGLAEQPPGILLWRSMMQWMGGIGIIVMAIVMLPFLGVGGMQLFHTESSDRSGRIVPRARQFAAYIGGIYSTLTLICFFLYWSFGMSAFDALNHAMTSLATGGYSTHDGSLGYFDAAGIQWTSVVFMLLGGIPFVAYIRAVRGRPEAFWRDEQIRGYLGIIAVICALLSFWLIPAKDMPFEEGVRTATFNVVSIVTSTGYATADFSAWSTLTLGLFFALLFIGGCTGSTAGGIKIYRHQILWITVRAYARRLVRPHRMDVLAYNGEHVTPAIQTSVLAFLAVYIGAFSVTAVVMAAMGLDFVTALSAAGQAFANVGPGLGETVGPATTFTNLPDSAKLVLAGAMILGRLELFTVLVLLDPDYWRG